MNQEGLERCNALQEKKYSASELQDELNRSRMLATLCHCSAEIDQGTLLYFSVHNMFLGSGDYILILFSENTPTSQDQIEGMDIFSRMYVYTLIREAVYNTFSGRMNFYCSELDGRLVVLILFQYGLLPAHREGLINQIGVSCRNISENCKKKYDIQVVSYISDVISQISSIASTYHKMLSVATLHRYIHRVFDDPVYHLIRPQMGAPSPVQIPIKDKAHELAAEIVNQGDYHDVLQGFFDSLTNSPLQSSDEVKRSFGELFESLCEELQLLGIRLNVNRLRNEEMPLIMEDIDWQRPVKWFHSFVQQVADACSDGNRSVINHNLKLAEQYINEHLDDQSLSIKSVADAIEISVTALSGMFRKQLNTTPAKYIRDARLSRACELLQSNAGSIQEICSTCGFSSLETFHRVFKAAYGITPGKMRRMAMLGVTDLSANTL